MKHILSSISLLGLLACGASAAPYVLPTTQSGTPTPYDIQPFCGVEGLYNIAEDSDMPDTYGVRLSFNLYDSADGPFRHQFNINVASAWGSEEITYPETTDTEDVDLFLLPVTMGYNLHIALTDKWYLFMGAKAGYAWSRAEYSYDGETDGTDGNGFTYSVGGGLRVQCSDSTYVHVGYEFGRSYLDYNDEFDDEIYGAHTVSFGISTQF